MLDYNEIKEKRYIILDDEPYEVLESQVTRKQAQKPVNQTKLRNLITGSVKQNTFHASDKVHEADLERRDVTYLFNKYNRQTDSMEFWFCEKGNKSNRFELPDDVVGDNTRFIVENKDYEVMFFEDQPIGMKLPIKVHLTVTDAPPAVKGDTATGATKRVTLETGHIVNTPLFIAEGDVLAVKTDSGEYTERISQ